MKFFKTAGCAILSVLLLVACNKSTAVAKPNPKRVITNDILLVLGEDYYQRTGILSYLENNYGVNTEDSHVRLLTYQDMLTDSGYLRLRSILDAIDSSDCSIVIAVGLPEGSARYFMQAADTHPEKVYVSLLPMEDTLQLEAACDMIVDFKLPDTLMNAEEAFTVSDDRVQLLLVASVFAGEDIQLNKKALNISIYEEFNRAFFTAYSVLYPGQPPQFKVSPYVDVSTSLPSRKYFIVYETTDTMQGGATDE